MITKIITKIKPILTTIILRFKHSYYKNDKLYLVTTNKIISTRIWAYLYLLLEINNIKVYIVIPNSINN